MSVQSTDFSTEEYFSCQILCPWVHAKLLQSCPTLCDPMDCTPPGSSVHRMLQVRILEWVAMPSSRGSSWPKDQTCISFNSCIAGRFFTTEPLVKPPAPCMNPFIPIDAHDKVQTRILPFCSTKPLSDPAFHSFMPVFSLVTRLHCHLSL